MSAYFSSFKCHRLFLTLCFLFLHVDWCEFSTAIANNKTSLIFKNTGWSENVTATAKV